MTMKIGNPAQTDELGTRDAFHVPAVLVCSKYPLAPGQDVRFDDEACTRVVPCGVNSKPHGIIDPFIPDSVAPGGKCWVMLRPELVHGLYHHYKIVIDGQVIVTPDKRVEELEDQLSSLKERLSDKEKELGITNAVIDKIKGSINNREDEDDECRGCYGGG